MLEYQKFLESGQGQGHSARSKSETSNLNCSASEPLRDTKLTPDCSSYQDLPDRDLENSDLTLSRSFREFKVIRNSNAHISISIGFRDLKMTPNDLPCQDLSFKKKFHGQGQRSRSQKISVSNKRPFLVDLGA